MYRLLTLTRSVTTKNLHNNVRSRPYNSDINVTELQNGIRIATQESCSPLSCTSLFIATGSRYENANNNGICNFIEHMVCQSFNSMTYNLQNNVYDNGVKLMARSTREYQVFTTVSFPDKGNECVDILAKIIKKLRVSNKELELQKKLINDESIDTENNPKSLVFDYLHQTAFQGTTLEQSVIGPSVNQLNFNYQTISDFIETNYKPNQILFVSTGAAHSSLNISKINANLGCMGTSLPVDYEAQRYTGSSIVYRDDSMPFAHVAIAVEAPGYNSADYLPLTVASCLIGAWDRTQGGTDRHGFPLARAAATSKLCEKFESFYITYRDIGLWGVYFIGNREGLDDMVDSIQNMWMQICTTTTKTDVQRAVNLTKLKLAKRVDGLINSCHDIGLQLLYRPKWTPLSELYDELNKIKPELVREVAHKYIYDKCPVVAAIGPTETLLEYGRIRCGMYWLRF